MHLIRKDCDTVKINKAILFSILTLRVGDFNLYAASLNKRIG
jgi:hypothetical protein